MNRQNLKNKDIDQIGTRLFEVTKPSADAIEQVVADPELFDSIKARIKAKEQITVEPKQSLLNWNRLKLSFLNHQMAFSSVAILAVFFIFVAIIVVTKQDSNFVAEEKIAAVAPETQTKDFARSENEIKKDDSVSESTELANDEPKVSQNSKKNKVRPQYASARKKIRPKSSKKRKSAIKKSAPVTKTEPQKVFYMLPYSGDSEIQSENIQIVSAKLSRSELFALGVNLQLENENSAVETELIIGADGVARAIRVIEKY